ncbi:hypothetical protein ZWY2020_003379 [Hordeum vulgare]|nr:hypothetical protein ZWY2020_003379 [Hordeum vulgare]
MCVLYLARCMLRLPAVRAEFRHHVGMNYLFAPWISWLMLLQATPFLRPDAPSYHMLWWAVSLPILVLDVKVNGQWFTRGRKFLSMVANLPSHMTMIANLMTARVAAKMGWHEGAVAIPYCHRRSHHCRPIPAGGQPASALPPCARPDLDRSLPSAAFVLLWSLALFTLSALCVLYLARCVLRLPAVRAEFQHHVGMNYLFAPWISWLVLLQATPFLRPDAPSYHMLWWAISLPILVLDVKVYGQWFTRGRKFLSMVANPASHMTMIANLMTARVAAKMGWHEGAVAMFARRHRALPRVVRHAVPEVPRLRLAVGHAPPGLLSLLRRSKKKLQQSDCFKNSSVVSGITRCP